jgi:L-ascorbate metabolism protein UlaG (beta-lactamase superfamily)
MSIKITWYGHSAFQVDTDGFTLLIDPFISQNPLAPIRADDLHADFILLTHAHGDHLGDTVPIAKRTGAMVIGSAEVEGWMKTHGVQNTHGPNTGGAYGHPFGIVKFVKAEHSSSFPDGTYGGQAHGFVLTLKGKRVYIAGDTALFSDMRLIGDLRIDVAVLPIGDNWTMGVDDSLHAIRLIRPQSVFPCHYNTFPLIQVDVANWARRVNVETEAKAIVVDPGSWFEVD